MKDTCHISSWCIIRNGKVRDSRKSCLAPSPSPLSGFLLSLYRHCGISYPKFHKMDNLSKLGFLAAEILLGQQPVPAHGEKDKTGIVLANSASSLDTDIVYQRTIAGPDNYFPSPSVFVYTLPNVVMGELCIRHGFLGENTFFVQERFDSAFLHDYVVMLLETGAVKRCITGWLELEGEHHDAVLFLIEKSQAGKEGIAIFTAENMEHIYSLDL